jgi:hypothetical protein
MALNPPHVLEGLVDDRQADDRVDDVGVRADAAERAGQQRDAVPDREEAHVEQDVLQPVEEENHPDEEQQVVVARDHMFRTEVHQRNRCRSVERQQVPVSNDRRNGTAPS